MPNKDIGKVDINRVVLRQLSVADVTNRYVAWLNDPEVNRYMTVRHFLPVTRDDVLKYIANCEKNRLYHWGIFVDDIHAGNVTFFDRDDENSSMDVSNIIGEPKYRGTNLSKIALTGAIDYICSKKKLHRIEANVYSDNLPGITLLTNLGFKKEGVRREAAIIDNTYMDFLIFGLLSQEWFVRSSALPKVKVLPPSWDQALVDNNVVS